MRTKSLRKRLEEGEKGRGKVAGGSAGGRAARVGDGPWAGVTEALGWGQLPCESRLPLLA